MFTIVGHELREEVRNGVCEQNRNMLEALVREGSLNWLLSRRSTFAEEFEERSPSAGNNLIPELSPFANIVVRRCQSRILGTTSIELQESFNAEASDSVKHKSWYARNFLEYCCFRTLALSAQVMGHLADKKFRRLTFDMMVAWEAPAASSQSLINLDDDLSVGMEAFSRIAPAVPIIANVIICENLFEVLTISTGGRLQFSIYDKYLNGLERYQSAKKFLEQLKDEEPIRIISFVCCSIIKRRKILEVDGTVTTYQFLNILEYQHGQSEPAIIEFPELKGHTRRRALSKAVLGILHVQAVQEISSSSSVRFESLLMLTFVTNCPGRFNTGDSSKYVKLKGITGELLLPVMELGKFASFAGMAGICLCIDSIPYCNIYGGYEICNQGRPSVEIMVKAPPPMTTMEQLLAVQNAISQAEQLIQDGNIALLKFRALQLSIFPQASEKLAAVLVFIALILALVPSKYMVMVVSWIRYEVSPPRKANTEDG
ncbi:VQ motif-containing family protein [Hibiscus syriacus]|uniref:VQ motif-containing family protein n=1 Tax=Hibiscus syriacus TaxID=106335 RepID=A0A6A3B1U8_HIBSY|nr:VQ motif-containing family protein [Hibiscus syriacus]